MSTQINPDRLAALDTITLDSGAHPRYEDGHCAMEVVAYIAGEPHTDRPACASPVLTEYVISLNDSWDDEARQALTPYLPRLVGTRDGQDEARAYMALDWLIRTCTPAWLDLAGCTEVAAELRALRRIVDKAAAKEARPVAVKAREAGAATGAAAWDAALAAAWDAALAAARAAALAAARAAAWDAALAAAWDAALAAARAATGDAARAATGDAAGAAARAATGDAAAPTVAILQVSALDLLDHMIDPTQETPDA